MKEVLKEWIIVYLKSRDVMTNSISSIDENVDGFDLVFRRSTGDQGVLIRPVLVVDEVKDLIQSKPCALVVLNTRQNLDALISGWQFFVKNSKLFVYFVNPKLKNDEKWVLVPATHEFVTEKSSLKRGLLALFESVHEWRE